MIRVIRSSSLLHYSVALLAAMFALLFVVPGLRENLLSTDGNGMTFMQHDECYHFVGALVLTHFVSDLLIGLSYVAISATLAYLVHRARRDIPFHWVFLAFGLFIVACGSTHFMEAWTTYRSPVYWLAGYLKLITAVASVATAIVLPPLVPRTLALVRTAKLSEQHRLELEAANRELETVYSRVKELDELKTQFFTNVSHELRTPLALILGPAQRMLANDGLGEGQRQSVETIERNARTLLKHVNDLLDISKLEAGKMIVSYVETDLAELVRLTSAYFQSFALERGIDFQVDAPATLRAEADAEKLQRVVINLLSNAFKFTPDGGQVRCALSETTTRATLEVSDSGPGVPVDLRDAIFERFHQADAGATRRFGGTGLGLAITKEFVELHGGRVTVSDAPEGGALFQVELPRDAPAGAQPVSTTLFDAPVALRERARQALGSIESERRRNNDARRDTADNETQSAADDGSRVARLALAPLVLIVEDNAEMSRHIAETVCQSCRVESAFDGREGLVRALALRPDLIICDVMMPDAGGEEFLRNLRAREEMRDVPVLMLSARADEELRVRLLRAGAQDYLTKPFPAEELRARAENMISIKLTREMLQRELASQSRDLTELAGEVSQRRAEMERALQALREANRKLEAIIEASPLAIITLDVEGRVESWSAAAERIFGWRELEVLGEPLPTIPPELREEVAQNHAQAVVGRIFSNYEARRQRKDGTPVDVSISTAPLKDADGNSRGVLALVADITERKRAEEAVRENERRLQVVTDSAPVLIAYCDRDARYLFVNQSYAERFNSTREEIIGKRVPEVVGAEAYREFSQYVDAVLAGRRVEFEIEIPYERIGRHFMHVVYAPRFGEAGDVQGFVAVITDVSERRREEEDHKFLSDATTVLASSLDYAATLEAVAQMTARYLADYCLIDLLEDDGTITRLVTTHRDPARAEAWREMQRRFPVAPGARHTVVKVLETGEYDLFTEVTGETLGRVVSDPEHVEMLKRIGVRSAMTVPLTARGRIVGAISLISAESGRRYAERELRVAEELSRRAGLAVDNARLFERAQEANRAKDEFLATLSHELRTPLTPIIGWVHLMGNESVNPSQLKHGLAVIDKNSQALSRLINDLLDMSAILNGKMRIERAPVVVTQVVREAVETVRAQANHRGVRIELTAGCDANDARHLVLGDRTRLAQVFWNLLTNAVKFSPDGGAVRVSCAQAGGLLTIGVEDEGIGIDTEFLPHVFDRFRQADMSTTKLYGGLGIGLALVRSFVEAHGGTVRAESAGLDQGSRFVVTLPAAAGLRNADFGLWIEEERETSSASGSLSIATHTKTGSDVAGVAPDSQSAIRNPQSESPQSKRRLLLVEDAPDTLELLCQFFESRGFDVTACSEASVALDVASRSHFDIIVTDIGLPNIDGYELLRRLREESPHLARLPALALTGYAAEADVEAARAAGFDAHLAKPFEPATLSEAIDDLLARRASREDFAADEE